MAQERTINCCRAWPLCHCAESHGTTVPVIETMQLAPDAVQRLQEGTAAMDDLSPEGLQAGP